MTTSSDKPRVVVTIPVLGICYMQACAMKDATDEEILRVANAENPSGTSEGWSRVIRDQESPRAPVTCGDDPNRLHLILVC